MESYNLATITKKIYNSGFILFTLKTLRDILGIEKESTAFNIIKKLIQSEIIVKIEKNKYMVREAKVSDFVLANFIYEPSYISFESALNFYGILSQFPYEISSATTKKTLKKNTEGKIFSYVSIKKDLFWGYEKKGNFLIALPEKALADQIYLSSKGYKKINIDEYDLENISSSKLKKILKKYPETKQFNSFLKKINNRFSL